MAVVIDASAAVAWLLQEQTKAVHVERHLGAGMRAPALWVDEVANALVVAQRAGRRAPAVTRALLAQASLLGVGLCGSPGMTRIAELAIESSLTAYDAEYLHLALDRGASLLTLDQQLADAARSRGVTVLGAR